MKYLTISTLLAISFMTGCASNESKNNGFKQLKLTSQYKLSDFNPSKPIRFFKLRTYEYSGKKIIREFRDTSLWEVPEPVGGWYATYDRSIYTTLSPAERNAFNSLKPSVPQQGKIIHYLYGGGDNHNIIADRPYPRADNIFYISTNGRAGVVTNRAELQSFLGNIDTDAEISLMIWSDYFNTGDSNCYKKSTNGYEVYAGGDKIFMDLNGNVRKREPMGDKPTPCKE